MATRTYSRLIRSRSVVLIFGFLLLSEYARIAFLNLPAYVVRSFFYDSVWGLENVIYAVDGFIPLARRLLWELGLIITYFLFAVAAVALVRHITAGNQPSTTPAQ